MKKLYIIFTLLLSLLLISCSNDDALIIGVDFYPMPQIVDLIESDLEKEGIKVRKLQMDYNAQNALLFRNEMDGNLIQHQHFMNFFNNAQNADLVVAQPVYHSKFALYSAYYESVEDIEENETIYMPIDVVNTSRALLLLQSAGLITLKEGKTTDATLDDIVSNPKNLKFEQHGLLDTAFKYRDSGKRLAIMYPSYAKTAINLGDDSEFLFNEEINEITQTYAISFVVRSSMLNDSRIQKFIEVLTSEKVKQWIIDNYGYAAIPAF